MVIKTRHIANWGRYPQLTAEVATPGDRAEVRECLSRCECLIARGNGRCYGDASLSPHIVSTLKMNQLRSFDAETGVVECDSGLLLDDLLRVIVPAGWFFHVTPGTRLVTVGGCIASDVHGKNHPTAGCFSNWLISFELMRSDGSVVTCSRAEHTELFWQTCGGMGWTGIVLSARFQLLRLPSTVLRQTTVQTKNWGQMFRIFEENRAATYSSAWMDVAASGGRFGRGAVFLAEHEPAKRPILKEFNFPKKTVNVPFQLPFSLLNAWTIQVYNEFYFRRHRSGEQRVGLEAFFYPLDGLGDWNRLYGRKGFIQYQFCLPEKTAYNGIAQVLEIIQGSEDKPTLAVIKRHGDRPPDAIHSFPIRGYSLALDFPRTDSVFHLVRQLDELVWNLGGKIYLAKDACSAARMSRIHARSFGESKFWSLLRGRNELKAD